MQDPSFQVRILGIDPGTNALGYAVLDASIRELSLIDIGVLHLRKQRDHQSKLREIFLSLQEIIELHRPTQLAIESPFYGKNVQSMLKLGRAQGVAMAAGMTMGLRITEYSPKRIKQSVTGNGNATKEQVSAMLNQILQADFSKHSTDASDALATAYCHFATYSSPASKSSSGHGWKSFLKENSGRIIRG